MMRMLNFKYCNMSYKVSSKTVNGRADGRAWLTGTFFWLVLHVHSYTVERWSAGAYLPTFIGRQTCLLSTDYTDILHIVSGFSLSCTCLKEVVLFAITLLKRQSFPFHKQIFLFEDSSYIISSVFVRENQFFFCSINVICSISSTTYVA